MHSECDYKWKVDWVNKFEKEGTYKETSIYKR